MDETKIYLSTVVELIDARIAMLKAQETAMGEHPIANALDRAHALGGQLALAEVRNTLVDAVVAADKALARRA